MKKTILITMIISLFIFSAQAKTIDLYNTNQPKEILTRYGTHTILKFESEIEYASLGNENYYSISTDKKMDKLVVFPKTKGVKTNLLVETKDGTQYTFYLIEPGDIQLEYYDIVNIKPYVNIRIKDKIEMINQNKISMDPAIKNLVNIYDVDNHSLSTKGLNIYLKRALTIKNDYETVLWIRLHNTSNKTISIPLSSINIKEREVTAIAMTQNTENLKPDDFSDIYIFCTDNYVDSFTLVLNLNKSGKEYFIKDIPFKMQEFKVYLLKENEFTSVVLEDYNHAIGEEEKADNIIDSMEENKNAQ